MKKLKLITIKLSAVFVILITVSACGKKEADAPASTNSAAGIFPANPVNGRAWVDIAEEVSGTYEGTLFTHHSHNRGEATVTVYANRQLDISVTISHSDMDQDLSFSANFYGFSGNYLNYYSLVSNLNDLIVTDIHGRRVWVTGMSIYSIGGGNPELFLEFQAVDYDYDEFGPWDIFYWYTYQVEPSDWITISDLTK